MKVILIDGYVDEPTCLGVPPYLSTYVRYAAGALIKSGINEIDYITIDALRTSGMVLSGKYENAVIIAGNPVPGKYLGGLPIEAGEFDLIASKNPKTSFFAGGPIQSEFFQSNCKNLKYIKLDLEHFIYRYFSSGKVSEACRNLEEVNTFALCGAFIAAKHPNFPDIIAEIETGRGCPRKNHCSFCVEGNYTIEFRDPQSVISEVQALYQTGVRHFRIGKQPDLFAYGSQLLEWKAGFPKPNPEWIKRLYSEIRETCPDIKTLHLDNVNPGTIANFPNESAEIAKIITEFNTAGDVAALGMESADPEVIKQNELKASPEEIFFAVKLLNDIGAKRENGLPKLLPGINLIRGLTGENRETFKMNYDFLKHVLDSGLLLRRINIRQIRYSASTPISGRKNTDVRDEKKLDAAFRNWREAIRQDIDVPMIKKVFPAGTLFPELLADSHRGDWTIARPLASYPVAVNIPKILPIGTKFPAFIIDYRERSLVGLQSPFILSQASLAELKQIPGYSKRAGAMFAERRFNPVELKDSPIFDAVKSYLG